MKSTQLFLVITLILLTGLSVNASYTDGTYKSPNIIISNGADSEVGSQFKNQHIINGGIIGFYYTNRLTVSSGFLY